MHVINLTANDDDDGDDDDDDDGDGDGDDHDDDDDDDDDDDEGDTCNFKKSSSMAASVNPNITLMHQRARNLYHQA